MARGRSRDGFRISPPRYVTPYQPSNVQSTPIMARPNAEGNDGGTRALESATFAAAGANRPTATSSNMEPTLSAVIRFWTKALSRTPTRLVAVKKTIAKTPAMAPPVNDQGRPRIVASARTFLVEKNGRNAPRYSPN